MDKMTKYRVAAIQFNPRLGDKEYNLSRLLAMCREAAGEGAKLIVLPEMGTTGYCFYDREEIAPHVETVPGPTTAMFARICLEYDCFIVLGLPEVDPEKKHYYNTCALIGPEGMLGKYRKTHAFASEPKWAKDGDLGFPVFDTQLGKIGCGICMDFYYFEPARIYALRGADVICNPTNWCYEKAPAASWFSRAWENGIYLISADRCGRERGVQFSGGSSIIKPDGSLQNYIDVDEGIVYGEVDLEAAAARRSLLNSRKTGFYHSLTLSTYLNNPYYFHRLYGHRPLPQGSSFKAAVGQFSPVPMDCEQNLAKIASLAKKAALAGASLVVFPELALTGPLGSLEDAQKGAQQLPGDPAIQTLLSIAGENSLYLVLGIAEKDRGQLYNSIVLLGKDGLAGRYRKVHLNDRDKVWAAAGEAPFPWFDLEGARVGLLTADDTFLPESAMCQAVWGTDLICVCGAVNDPLPLPLAATALELEYAYTADDSAHWHLWRTRAVETSCYLAFANQAGPGGMGFSGIFGPMDLPRNEEIAGGMEEALLTLSVETDQNEGLYPQVPARAKDTVRMRLPHLYDPLI